MERRAFIATIASRLLTAPVAVEAQQAGKVYKIGILTADLPQGTGAKSFLQGLHGLGYVEDRSFAIEYRFAEGHQHRLPELAADFDL